MEPISIFVNKYYNSVHLLTPNNNKTHVLLKNTDVYKTRHFQVSIAFTQNITFGSVQR